MARHPLRVGIADLRRRPGTRRRVEESVPLDDLEVSTARVPAGEPVVVDLELETLSDGLVATGTIDAPWTGECRRCLRPVEGRAVVEVREIFQPRPVEGETYAMGEDIVDLEPMVRDAVLLALPLAPLCADDCRGPAPEEFPTGSAAEGDRTRPETPVDPRWAALSGLDFEPDDRDE
ncbi:MAG: DUF177 domain-containing protein [Acidimicrobiia bacterium]|nr:DUF177 domain-containing protein [Acidimicrobiia bacterium]